jgi:hypothetical protein
MAKTLGIDELEGVLKLVVHTQKNMTRDTAMAVSIPLDAFLKWGIHYHRFNFIVPIRVKK